MSTITMDFRHHYQRGERREAEQVAYQWDLGHVAEIFVPLDATYNISYCFSDYDKTDDYVVESITAADDGGYKLTAHVPNKYFERSGELRVYVIGSADDHIITTYEGFITIRGRLMPDDYVDDDPENDATQIIEVAREYATKSESFAVGGTGTRLGEDTDNAKYYKERAEEVAESIPEDYSELSADVDQLKNALTAVEIVDTASGAIVSFADGSDGVPVKGLTVSMEPIQAGSGDPSPTNIRPISGRTAVTVTRTGKNLFNRTNVLGGYINSSGQFVSSNAGEKVVYAVLPTGTYRYSHSVETSLYRYAVFDNIPVNGAVGTVISSQASNLECTFTLTKTSCFGAYCYNNTGEPNSFEDVLNSIQIELGSSTTAFEAPQIQQITLQLGQTVYGGTLDVTTGVLTADFATKVFNGTETYNNQYFPTITCVGGGGLLSPLGDYARSEEIVCSHCNTCGFSNPSGEIPQWRLVNTVFGVSNAEEFKAYIAQQYANGTPMTMSYPISNPITVQLTAQQMTTLLGQNNVWSDASSVSVDYVADTKLYIAKVIADALS